MRRSQGCTLRFRPLSYNSGTFYSRGEFGQWFRQVLLLRMHLGVRFHVSGQHGSESAKGASGRLHGFKYSFHLSTVDFEAHFKAKKYKSRSKFYLVERLIGRRRSKNEV